MKTRKLGKVLLAFMVAAVLTGLAPAVSGTNEDEQDAITRTFDSFVFAEVTFKNFGTGIYDFGKKADGEDPKQVCPISVLGLRAVVSDVFYYQSNREATNLALGVTEVTGAGAVNLGEPCPIPGTDQTNDQWIVIEDMNVKNPYDAVSVDQLLCTKRAFLDCFPKPDTGKTVIAACHYLDSHFSVRKDETKVSLIDPFGSAEIDCNGDWFTKNGTAPFVFYDEVTHCPDYFFDVGIWGMSFCLVQNEQIVPYGAGSSYLTSCMRIEYNAVNVVTGDSNEENATSHDYKLIKDLGTPEDWPAAEDWHLGTQLFTHPKGAPINDLQGWHDLTGQNGCPFDMDGPNNDDWDPGQKKSEKTKESQLERLLEELLPSP